MLVRSFGRSMLYTFHAATFSVLMYVSSLFSSFASFFLESFCRLTCNMYALYMIEVGRNVEGK